MNVHYVVELPPTERGELEALGRAGRRAAASSSARGAARRRCRAADLIIATTVGRGAGDDLPDQAALVERGIERALHDDPRPGAGRKLTARDEALLVAVACSKPPTGRARWTLELLAGEVVRLTEHTALSRETVRRRLHEKAVKPWQHKMWCLPAVDAEFVARMPTWARICTTPARPPATRTCRATGSPPAPR